MTKIAKAAQKKAVDAEFETDLTTITVLSVTPEGTYEYSLNGTTWQDSSILTGLKPSTEYTVYIRAKGNENYLASSAERFKAKTAFGVNYIDKDGNEQATTVTYLDRYTSQWNDGAWYIVESGVLPIYSRVEVSGNVNLIIADDTTLNANYGIHVPVGSSLTIYRQSGGSGFLNARTNNSNAAIGANENEEGGAINIYGGTVNTASSSSNAYGINGNLTVGNDLFTLGGDTENPTLAIDSTERKQYMTVVRRFYTIFFTNAKQWAKPYVKVNGKAAAAMEKDGFYWRYTTETAPTKVQFTEGGSSGSSQCNVDLLMPGMEPVMQNVGVYGEYMVVLGSGHIVYFSYADGTATLENGMISTDNNQDQIRLVADGSTVQRPNYPSRSGYSFVRWEKAGLGNLSIGEAYNFDTPVNSSFELFAVWRQQQFNVSFYGYKNELVASSTVYYGNKVSKPENPSAPSNLQGYYAFQKWVIAETVRTTDATGNKVELVKGTPYDFNKPVYADIKLNSVFVHTHQYTSVSLVNLAKSYPQFEEFVPALHYTYCAECDYEKYTAHTFDANNRCTQCGYVKPQPNYNVRVFVDGLAQGTILFQTKTVKGNESFNLYAPSVSRYDFVGWYVVAAGEKPDYNKAPTSRDKNIKLTAGSSVDIYGRLAVGYWEAKPRLELQTSDYHGYIKADMNWKVPVGAKIYSAGFIMSTNFGMRNIDIIGGEARAYTNNVMRKYQDRQWYEPDLKAELLVRMVYGYGYINVVNMPKTAIHTIPVSNMTNQGSYTTLFYYPGSLDGNWRYIMTYLLYTDRNGTMHSVYAGPVAVNSGDSWHYDIETDPDLY